MDALTLGANERAIVLHGVPGSGKTLAGLNIANLRNNVNENEHAVFLSGNGPLVEVLQEGLARDQKEEENIKHFKVKNPTVKITLFNDVISGKEKLDRISFAISADLYDAK